MSIADSVVEAVMGLVDSLNNYAVISRGALGTGNDLTCEVATSSVDGVFLDKNPYVFLDLTFNGKHWNLETLTNTLNNIMDSLTLSKEYPSGDGWEIVDISRGSPPLPTIIGREEQNQWIMACAVIVKYYQDSDIQPPND